MDWHWHAWVMACSLGFFFSTFFFSLQVVGNVWAMYNLGDFPRLGLQLSVLGAGL
jgi:hypothetical protein